MKRTPLMLLVLLVLIWVFLFAAFIVWAVNEGHPSRVGTDDSTIEFWHDTQRSVGCWVYHAGNKGGISCVPDDQYK